MLRGCFDLPVESAMKATFQTARPDESIDDVMCRIEDDGIIVIVDDKGKLEGVLTPELLLSAKCKGVQRVGDAMNREPITLKPGMSLDRALPLLLLSNLKAAPVVDGDGNVLGIVTLPLIAKALHEEIDVEELPSAG